MKKMKKGFTLIELVVVMALIAVLSLLVVGAIMVARQTSQATTNRANGKTIQTAAEAVYAKNNSYSALGTSASIPFTTAAATLGTELGTTVTLAGSVCDGTTEGGATNPYSGGGVVKYNATTGWTIVPVDYRCNAAGEMTEGAAVLK